MSTLASCPHCQKELPPRPPRWYWLPPWQCSHCGELYGWRETKEPKTYRIHADIQSLRYLMTFEQARHWAQFNSGNQPYVYAVCYPNGIPFYVGKGRALRLCQHGHCVRTDSKNYGEPKDEKERTIRKLVDLQSYELYTILALCESDAEAYRFEARAIALWGRRSQGDLLANQDDGQLHLPVHAWVPPRQPAIQANGTNSGYPWVVHPEVNHRARSHKGLIVECPSCRKHCMHPANVVMHGARCPNCCFFLNLDGETLREYWLDNRPRPNGLAAYTPSIDPESS